MGAAFQNLGLFFIYKLSFDFIFLNVRLESIEMLGEQAKRNNRYISKNNRFIDG